MADARNLVSDNSTDPQLFFEFAAEGIARLFALFNLPSGKLPFERHGLMARTLTDKHVTTLPDEGRDYAFHCGSLPSVFEAPPSPALVSGRDNKATSREAREAGRFRRPVLANFSLAKLHEFSRLG
jgi:hypothetical protein